MASAPFAATIMIKGGPENGKQCQWNTHQRAKNQRTTALQMGTKSCWVQK